VSGISWCKHHHSPGALKHECALGLDIEAMTTAQVGAEKLGRHYMLPCHTSFLDHITKAKCDKRLLPTQAEIAQHEKENAEMVAEFVKRLEVVEPWVASLKRNHKGQDAAGTDKCPVCGGTVAYRHAAYNGHVAAKCKTPDCLNFME